MRIHPAVIAQAAATTASLFDGRFFLGVGTGENLNEHIVGDRWPPTAVRREMLAEAVEVMRKLWTASSSPIEAPTTRVEDARIYTLPENPSTVCVAAGGPEAAELAARSETASSAPPPTPSCSRRSGAAGAGHATAR